MREGEGEAEGDAYGGRGEGGRAQSRKGGGLIYCKKRPR